MIMVMVAMTMKINDEGDDDAMLMMVGMGYM
jgi:hypothetical protein